MTKRLLVGRPLRSERMGETLLPKRLALPVFCSDRLSSNAFATEEMLRALSIVVWRCFPDAVGRSGGDGAADGCGDFLPANLPGLPNGGGAYAVSRADLGRTASLIAASALYRAVSVAAGVDAITSAETNGMKPVTLHYHRPLLGSGVWPVGGEVLELSPARVAEQRRVLGRRRVDRRN